MTREELARWVEGYRQAWQSNEQDDIRRLFTEDARYYTEPFGTPWQGLEAIVQGWLGRRDEPGDTEFRFEILAVVDGVGFVRGWTAYRTPSPSEYSNLWVVTLADDGRASEFTEWWMQHP